MFTVPGSIFSPQSRGPLALLRDGATPVTSTQDIRETLNLTMIGAQMDFGRAAPPTDPDERALMQTLSCDPRHVDKVVRRNGLSAFEVASTMVLRELKGLVRNIGGMQYVRLHEDPAFYETVADETGAHGT